MLAQLKSYFEENGKEKTINLLKKYTTITEKINAHRVYCKKEKTGNILFYSKKKSSPITILDRITTDLYEPFIKHIISKKDKLQIGEHGFYFIKDDIDVEYSQKPQNFLLITDIPFKTGKTIVEIAIELDVSYAPPVFKGILNDVAAEKIIEYLENEHNEQSLLLLFNMLFDKNCSMFFEEDGIVEGFVFNFKEEGTFSLYDDNFVKKEFQKLNTASYELLVIEIFEFIKQQDFSTVKMHSKNTEIKKAEFIFEVFNRFVEQTENLENYLLNEPEFLSMKGKVNRRYINNQKTIDLISKNKKLEYLLRVFITAIKDVQKSRGVISQDLAEEHNYIILKINDYIRNSENLLDFENFRKFSQEI